MKKRIFLCGIGLVTMLAVTACGKQVATENKETVQPTVVEATAGTDDVQGTKTVDSEKIGNPWIESDKAGVEKATGFLLNTPEGAESVFYSYMEPDKMAQVMYTDKVTNWTYRAKRSEKFEDISGMHYEWEVVQPTKVAGLNAKFMGYSERDEEAVKNGFVDTNFAVHVVNWYDETNGCVYSLSAMGKELNGLDIEVVAENLFSNK